MQVSISDANTNLSNLIRKIELGDEENIIITRYGKPVVKLVRYQEVSREKQIGKPKETLHF